MTKRPGKTARTATNGGTSILLTNDDGMAAPGIADLYHALSKRASVVIAAPDRERSGVGHAFTFNEPLHYEKKRAANGLEGYVVSGTPVDCVKFAVSHLLLQRPDVVVAGLNCGENSGLSAFYSGTVAAAREGAFWDIPSVAFSVCQEGERHMKAYASIAAEMLHDIMAVEKRKKKHGVYYNVNFPRCAPEECAGTMVTAQSLAFFDDRYKTVDVETHHTKKGFVIYGEKKDLEKDNRFDSRALMNGYITITPLSFDATAHAAIQGLRSIDWRHHPARIAGNGR
jgi:5'-nucleotidase